MNVLSSLTRIIAWYLIALLAVPFFGFRAVNPTIEINSPAKGIDSVALSPGSYIWPTDASTRITSSFAEYRSSHFHGGIDISTNGVKGYKVFAVNDGYVYRVRIQPNGYGKMLFIKQSDGYISTYAHLMGFNDEIAKLARHEQYRRGTYAIDLTLNEPEIRVKKGDVVAYTGDTGFGPPHLHFEIRDRDMNPVNPLLIGKYPIEDRVPPTFERVMVSPLSYNSTIDNSSSPKFFRRFPRTAGGRTIPQKLIVHGKIGFGVSVHDRADGVWNRAGIHSLQFFLDDSLTYSMTLDRVLGDDPKQIYLHYDYPTILQGWGKFQKLYVETGTTLPIYNGKSEGSGIINTEMLSQGSHEYRIVCKDFVGNTTELHGSLLVNHSPKIAFLHVDDDDIVLKGNDLDLVSKWYVYGRKFSNPNWSQHTLSAERMERDNDGVEIPINTKEYDVLKIVAEMKWGSRTPPLFHFNRKPPESLRPVYIKTDIHNDYVRFTLTSTGMFTEEPKLIVHEGNIQQHVEVEPVDLYKYTGAYTPSSMFAGSRTATAQVEINGKQATVSDEFEIYSIPVHNRGSFTINPLGLYFSYDSAAVYKPLYMQVSSDNDRQSKVYVLEPQDQLLNRGIRISVPFDGDAPSKHLGLYFRSNGGWIFQTANPDSGRTTFSTTLRNTLGELVVLHDDMQPRMGRLRLTTRKGKLSLSFRYSDNLSGVDTDEIKMYIDDVLVIPEIDGEHRQVRFASDEPLAHGKHSLKISVKDRMKNETVVAREFSVR
ncbi:MAG: M23 family metallopeptidase [Ignavibacteriae bacterium]|nr:M23 family metallopeptidase [Ignavibacteria bacterium]MBI3363727.1 M23 family metallopeptidase [Ignavibacteriota bacterium]